MRGWLAREGGWFWRSVNLKAAVSIAGGGLEFEEEEKYLEEDWIMSAVIVRKESRNMWEN